MGLRTTGLRALTVVDILHTLFRFSNILPSEEVASMVSRIRLWLGLSTFFTLLLLSFHLPAQADWKADWEKTLAAARKEGNIRVYAPPGIGFINAIETFKSVYPDIKMVYVPGTGSQHSNRLGAERRAGPEGFL